MQKSQTLPKTPLRFIWYVSRPYLLPATAATVVVILAAAASQMTSYFFKLIVDASEVGAMDDIIFYTLMYPVVILAVQLLYRASGYLGMLWTTRSNKYTNDLLANHLLRHSHQYFSDRFAGSLLSKVGNVTSAIDQFIPDFLWTHVTALVSFLVTGIVIFKSDALSGILFLVLIVVLIVVNKQFANKKRQYSYLASEASTKLRGVIVDILSNMAAVRQYAQTKAEEARIEAASTARLQASHKNWTYTEVMLLLNTIILFVFSLVIFYLLVLRWQAGEITTGDFVFILALYSQITGTLIFIGRAFNNTARTFGEMEEGLGEVLAPYDVVDTTEAKPLIVSAGELVFSQVNFEFGANQIFKDFSLTVAAGERVGLVGHSGAGKTTFVSLLLRQHDLTQGEILIDGQNIASITQDSLRENIAVVPQEPLLFHRSIFENIAYGRPSATREEVIAVAEKAEAHEFIMSLKDGYDTLVGERGVKLSGGQRQRVAIARAMLKNAPLLVLDEATSALDSESEVAIQKALHALMAGKTVIAIAHRLSTLREMDRIVVIEKGKIIESGTHTELAAQGGVYAGLWKHQAGGFIE